MDEFLKANNEVIKPTVRATNFPLGTYSCEILVHSKIMVVKSSYIHVVVAKNYTVEGICL